MRFLFLLLPLLAATPVTAQSISRAESLGAAIDNYIRPHAEAFAAETAQLAASAQALCAAPSLETLQTVRDDFADAALAYGHIEFLRLGPLMENNRSERILFWPDRRSIGLKQVQALLAEEDTTATALSGLQAKSVAVQGLGALEFVLFGTGAETLAGNEGDYRCAYGKTIAGNLADIAVDIQYAWADPDGIAGRLAHPDSAYRDYRTVTEALEALTGLIAHGIEALRDTRINPFMAQGSAAARPKQAIFWRSDLTMAMINANVEGLKDLLTVSGLTATLSQSDADLALNIAAEFDNARRSIALVTLPIEQAVADEAQAQALDDLVQATSSLQILIGEDLSSALGLSVGFSSLDGD